MYLLNLSKSFVQLILGHISNQSSCLFISPSELQWLLSPTAGSAHTVSMGIGRTGLAQAKGGFGIRLAALNLESGLPEGTCPLRFSVLILQRPTMHGCHFAVIYFYKECSALYWNCS